MITSQFPSLGFGKFWVSPPEYFDLRERAKSFSEIGAYRSNAVNGRAIAVVTGRGAQQRKRDVQRRRAVRGVSPGTGLLRHLGMEWSALERGDAPIAC
jgi:hypothetical protein